MAAGFAAAVTVDKTVVVMVVAIANTTYMYLLGLVHADMLSTYLCT